MFYEMLCCALGGPGSQERSLGVRFTLTCDDDHDGRRRRCLLEVLLALQRGEA